LTSALIQLHDTFQNPRQGWAPEQLRAVAQVLAHAKQPVTVDELAARFTGRGPWKKRLPQVLETLEAVGRLRRTEAGAYLAT